MAKNQKASEVKKTLQKFQSSQEKSARASMLEDLFYDLHRSREQIYKMNFIRGILLGAGSVIGGTVVIALLVAALTWLGNFIPPLGNFFDTITTSLENPPKK